MRAKIDFECTPAEARAFLGLPDVTALNEHYVEMARKALSGASSVKHAEAMMKQFAPLGGMGLKLFEQFAGLATGAAAKLMPKGKT